MPKQENPMQPVYLDRKGVARFKSNQLVCYLLDANGTIDMNKIATFAIAAGVSKTDQEQFAQLIGYSVSGFGDLSYVRDKTYVLAARQVKKLLARKCKRKE